MKITHDIKNKIKQAALKRLHAKPEIISRVATRVLREGVPAAITWDYEQEKKRVLDYLSSLQVSEFEYKFSRSQNQACLYGSIYACMLKGMHGALDTSGQTYKQKWLEYFDSFQDPADGHFRDPRLACEAYEGSPAWGDGWGVRHLAGHIVICYIRLGGVPKYKLKFLEPYYEENYLLKWINGYSFKKNAWSQSNYIMNLYVVLQFAQDQLGERRAGAALEIISKWLREKQRSDTGMWHDYTINGYPELGDAIRGAYHFYPLFTYRGEKIPHADKVIDLILYSQNSWGGFDAEQIPSGSCADIDALEPLIRCNRQNKHRSEVVTLCLERALVWLLACRSRDGGFEDIPEHGCNYGMHPLTTSQPGEGNLFATWFRSLTLAYLTESLGRPNEYSLLHAPGYEIKL